MAIIKVTSVWLLKLEMGLEACFSKTQLNVLFHVTYFKCESMNEYLNVMNKYNLAQTTHL